MKMPPGRMPPPLPPYIKKRGMSHELEERLYLGLCVVAAVLIALGLMAAQIVVVVWVLRWLGVL